MSNDKAKIDKCRIKTFILYSIIPTVSHWETNELNYSEDWSTFLCGYLSEATFN